MGFFDKFKKKEENPFSDSKLNDPFESNPLGTPNDPYGASHEEPSDPFGHDLFNNSANNPQAIQQNNQYPTQQPSFPGQNQQQSYNNQVYEDVAPSRDVELILAKLDAIKAELDSVHQRVRKLEAAHDAKNPQQKYW